MRRRTVAETLEARRKRSRAISETPQPGCGALHGSTSISDWEMLMSALGRLIRRRVAERKSKTLDAISATSTSGRTSFALCPLTLGLGRWGEVAVLLITVPRSWSVASCVRQGQFGGPKLFFM